MSTRKNKELMRQYWKDVNEIGGEVAKVRPLFNKHCATGYIYHNPRYGDFNLEQTIQLCGKMVSAFSDVMYLEDDMIAEGDKVVTRYTLKGTHKGEYGGIPATGKQLSFKGMRISTIKGGKAVEEWDLVDYLSMMTQLGVIPAPKT
jgi:predicted ester cyclase